MNYKEHFTIKDILGGIIFVLGLVIMGLSTLDIYSIISDILNTIFNLDLPSAFLNSFVFRALAGLIGLVFFGIGILLLKNGVDESEVEGDKG